MARTSDNHRGLKVQDLPGRVGSRLKELDANADGILDAEELSLAVEGLLKSETKIKYWRRFMFVGVAFIVVQAGLMAGILYGIVTATQETQVDNNYLVTKDGDTTTPVVTAPYAWHNDVSLNSMVNMTDSQIQSVAAITLSAGGVSMISKVTMVMPAGVAGNRTVVLTTADAVVVVTGTTISMDWMKPEVRDIVDAMRPKTVPQARRSVQASSENIEPSTSVRRAVAGVPSTGCGAWPLAPCPGVLAAAGLADLQDDSTNESGRRLEETDASALAADKTEVPAARRSAQVCGWCDPDWKCQPRGGYPCCGCPGNEDLVPVDGRRLVEADASALVTDDVKDLPATRRSTQTCTNAPDCCNEKVQKCCCGQGANSVTPSPPDNARRSVQEDALAKASETDLPDTRRSTQSCCNSCDSCIKEGKNCCGSGGNLVTSPPLPEMRRLIEAEAPLEASQTGAADAEVQEARRSVQASSTDATAEAVETDLPATRRSAQTCCNSCWCCNILLSTCCCGSGGNFVQPEPEAYSISGTIAY